jgi:2-dehydro-3-deoxy-D-arabinonate dehydratase
MKLAKIRSVSGEVALGLVQENWVQELRFNQEVTSLSDILESNEPASVVESLRHLRDEPVLLSEALLLPPIDHQEVWAAGVTYKRSKTARMEESDSAATCYDRVYTADRPELFFKALPHRVSGPGQPVRIRRDSNWNVPEPELALVLNTRLEIVGFTIGNDMSSRSIEGDNPLYLPQAKVYSACCGLGPCITLADAMPPRADIGIKMVIRRGDAVAFEGETGIREMARSFEDLISWLARDNEFPTGAMLLTGTGIVPDSDFTLQSGDLVDITIDGIGTLSNPVVQA